MTDNDSLTLLQKHICDFDYFAFDTETTGLNVRKDKVIGLSICGEIGTAFYLPLFTWDKAISQLVPVWGQEKFREILKQLQKKDLITWNGSFDSRIVKSNFGIDLAPSILADGMMMKHTVEEDGDFRLKETALELAEVIGLGGEHEAAANEEQMLLKENVLANGGTWLKNDKQMFKADLEVMGPYACADADLTLRIAAYYQKKLEQEGLESFFYDQEVMPLYKEVTIPMEEHGVKLDLPLIEQTKIDIEIDMAELQKSILEDLNALGEVQAWLRQKALDTFPPSVKGSFAQAVAEEFKLDLPLTPAGKYSITAKTLNSISDSAAKHFLQGTAELNPGMNHMLSWKLFVKSGESEINISSKKQMGHIAFECLGIKPLGKTPTGLPQFDDDMIESLAQVHKLSWAEKLSSYNKLVKIRGTYIDRFLDAHEDGFYYFSYKQHGTVSGRYSGDAQQLPRPKEEEELAPVVLKYNNLVRSFFISEEERIFIDCDYNSLEPNVFAHVSGDDKIKDIFRNEHDFYSTIAIVTERLEQYSADKAAANYLGKMNKPKRQSAKPYSLGIPYGMTAFALGKTLGISTKEAEILLEGYLTGFPDLAIWMDYSKDFVKAYGYMKSQAGRVRHLPRAKELFKKHDDQLLDWRYRTKLVQQYSRRMSQLEAKELVKKEYGDYKNSVNNSLNFQIQSLAASITNAACIAVNREFKRIGINGYCCAQIHDQAIFNVPSSRVEECKGIVQYLMENTTKLSVILRAPPCIAKNWKEGH